MKMNLVEDIDSIQFEYSDLTRGIESAAFKEVKECLDFIQPTQVHYRIVVNDTITNEDSIDDLLRTLDSFLDDDTNTHSYKIQIEFSKIQQSEFLIYSPEAFVKSMPTNFNEILRKLSYVKVRSSSIKTRESEYRLPIIDARLDGTANIPLILSENRFKPEDAHELAKAMANEPVLSKFFKLISCQYCLACLASSFDFNTPRNFYTFDGYASLVSTTENDENYISRFEAIFQVYEIVFADNNFNTRLGLLRNLVSLKHVENISQIFDDSLIKSLHSNYQIYLRENIKQYIEVKNKSIELMHGLVDKAADKFEDKQKSHQKALVGLATFYFSAIIGKVVLKSNVDMLSFEFAVISTLFMFFVFWFVHASKVTLEKSRNQLSNQVTILKNRYKNILHDTEIDEIFDNQQIDECFDESNDFLSTTTYNAILIVPIVVLWITIIVKYSLVAAQT